MMLAIAAELLTGRYVATEYNDRTRAEWPPHPARLFSAMVAALHRVPQPDPQEREALQWLEGREPAVLASRAHRRAVTNVFVPVPDTTVIGSLDRYFERVAAATEKIEQLKTELEDERSSKLEKKLKKAQAGLGKAIDKLHERAAKQAAADGKTSESAVKSAVGLLPEHRGKQPRTFPSLTPDQARVVFVWRAAPPEGLLPAFDRLCASLTRLGHSSSLVMAHRVEDLSDWVEGLDWWVPQDSGSAILRVPAAGQLSRLEEAFGAHQAVEPRTLPCAFQRYGILAGDDTRHQKPKSVFSPEWLLFTVHPEKPGARRTLLPLSRAEDIARAIRGALLRYAVDPPPLALSGHRTDGQVAESPHVAYLPLPDVGHKWAQGYVLGVALVLPRELSTEDRYAVLTAIARWEQAARTKDGVKLHLRMGRAGDMYLQRLTLDPKRSTLRGQTWSKASRRWATATPIALDRNPGSLFARSHGESQAVVEQAEETIAQACLNIGLPRPKWVEVMKRSVLKGSRKASEFMPFPRRSTNGFKRVCIHAEICFSQEVEGPVLLGAGRYFGLGLCKPIDERN